MNKPPEKQPRKVLGKGLSALLPPRGFPEARDPVTSSERPNPGKLPIALIDPNPFQPRSVFDPSKLHELADSISVNGIIQPLIVRRKNDRYELIAGERRLRAAQEAGLEVVPVVIQDYADDQMLELALIENIQREDLNPIETAQALHRLVSERNLSHEEIGRRTGKDRTTISNLLRLLKLPPEVQLLLAERRLSMGHARAILGLTSPDEQRELADRSAAQGYSVRQVERAVQTMTEHRDSPPNSSGNGKAEKRRDPNVAAAAAELESALGTRVRIIEKTDQRGRIEIEYYSQDDLQRIYEGIVSAPQRA
ncbi:MAG: ParB/RepB/Spo0J family partition protein [Bryobacteraceae bacterium]